jgi:uncharacterized membrane protein YdjX (TVP38/TMEM64 family)
LRHDWVSDVEIAELNDRHRLSAALTAFVDPEQRVRARVQSAGWAAPLVFIGLQIAQVIAAPIPGEATGFIGGYIFGAAQGFLFSSIGLTLGSMINFGLGRVLGRRYVRKLIPEKSFERLDRLINRQGIIVIFLMLLIPGFPKDYLCLLLGLSTLSPKLFVLLAAIGRMPGTLRQGTSLLGTGFSYPSSEDLRVPAMTLHSVRWQNMLSDSTRTWLERPVETPGGESTYFYPGRERWEAGSFLRKKGETPSTGAILREEYIINCEQEE